MEDDIWRVLDLAPVRDRAAIRRAYARRLKVTSPEEDAEGFQVLRAAYEQALAWADSPWTWGGDEEGAADGAATVTATRVAPRVADESVEAGPVDAQRAAHARAMADLVALFDGGPEPGWAVVEAALKALVASPAMDDLTLADQTEQQIAQMVVEQAPRFDGLARSAINVFGWRPGMEGGRRDVLIQAALDRDADIVFRQGVLAPGDPRGEAFRALARPPEAPLPWRRRLSPRFELHLRRMVEVIAFRRPSLRADVDARTLALWSDRFSRPRVSVAAWWIAVVAPLAGLPFVASPLMGLGVYLGGLVLAVGLALAHAHGVSALRHMWERNVWRAPLWLRVGWSPASLALLAGAAFLPPSPIATAGVAAVAGLLALWAGVTGEHAADGPGLSRPMRIALMQSLLAAWWLTLMVTTPSAAPARLTLAFAGVVLVDVLGGEAVTYALYNQAPRIARAALALLVGGAGGGVAWLILTHYREPAWGPVFAALVAAVVVAHRPFTAVMGRATLTLRYYLMAFSLLFLWGPAFKMGLLAASGLWLLGGVGVSLVSGLVVDRDHA